MRISRTLLLALTLVFVATSVSLAGSTLSLVATPFQKPALQGDIVVAVKVSPADGVTSMDLAYQYDSAVLAPRGVYRTAYTNAFVLTWSLATPGVLRIHLSGSIPLNGSGEVAWIVFRNSATSDTMTPITWTSAVLNGGSIPCTTTNLLLPIRSAPVIISIPDDVSGAPRSQVLIPINSSSSSGGSSYDLSITFNPAVLSPVSVQTTPLTSCMNVFANLSIPGTVNVGLYGLCSVSGSGPLIKILFNVVGPSGSRTPLNVTRGAIDEEHIASVLEDGLFSACDLLDLDGDGYTTCGGDCDDSNAAIHPNAAEACNMIDDNCDGIVDNVQPPTGRPTLTLSQASGDTQLTWAVVPSATSYDLVRGNLETLAESAGNFTLSTDRCLPADIGTGSNDLSNPGPGAGFWYLVRACNCGGQGSYDGGDAAQVGLCDTEIEAAPGRCP